MHSTTTVPRSRRRRAATAAAVLSAVLVVVLPGLAEAAVSVTRAEVKGSELRLEGRAIAGRTITVDGVAMGTTSSSGSFSIRRSGYTRPADCTVDVNDGSAAAVTVRLSGCTVSTTPSPTPTPAPTTALQSITMPSSMQGGGTASATVTLTAPAPTGGAVVSLTSSNPALITVPGTITVPAGATSHQTFASTSEVTADATVTVSATYAGVTRSATITLTPPPAQPAATLDSVALSPALVHTGTTSSTATLSLTAGAPAGGAVVTLASSNTTVATVPASVTVPANSWTGAFPVSIRSSAVGTTSISATYQGVTRAAVLTVQAESLLRITDTTLPNAKVGADYAGFIGACCGQGGPYRWRLVDGRTPDGLRFAGDDLRLTQSTGVVGVATRVQTTTFTVEVEDQAGNTDRQVFTLTVDPADPLTITNQGDELPPGRVGVEYETGVFPGGGVPPYRWSHVAGQLPPGLSVQASPGRVLGTPTTPGTFAFTLRVTDAEGSTAQRQFTITVT